MTDKKQVSLRDVIKKILEWLAEWLRRRGRSPLWGTYETGARGFRSKNIRRYSIND